METILGRFRNLIVLAAILFAQIMGLAVQVKLPAQAGETRLLRLWAVAAITPFESAVVHTQKFFHDSWHNYVYLRGVRGENRELRAELDHMKLEQVRLREDAEMARRIQSLLAFKEQYIDSTVAAQVIGTSGSDQSRVLYIDKGSNDGIARDMAVITPNGIVGKIVQVFPDSAQVLPINDQLSGVGVVLQGSRLQGTLKGAADGSITVQYIMSDEKVEPGEQVVTTGGDRIFPRGLPVGKVVSSQPGHDLFLNIKVAPAADLNRIDEVLVVTKKTEKLPDTEDLGPIRASDILAQRLPGVPSKPEIDAKGNVVNPNPATAGQAAAPGAATATQGTTATRGTALGAVNNRGVAGANPTNKPAASTAAGATASGSKPSAGTVTPRPSANEAGPAATAPKPVRKPPANATSPDGTAQPVPPPAGDNPQR